MAKVKDIINLASNIKEFNFYLLNEEKLNKKDSITIITKKQGSITIDLTYYRKDFNDWTGKLIKCDVFGDNNQERPTHYNLKRRIGNTLTELVGFIDNATNLKLKKFYFYEDKKTNIKSLDFVFEYEVK